MVRELDDLLKVLHFLTGMEKTVPFAQNFHSHFVVQSYAIITPPPTAFVFRSTDEIASLERPAKAPFRSFVGVGAVHHATKFSVYSEKLSVSNKKTFYRSFQTCSPIGRS